MRAFLSTGRAGNIDNTIDSRHGLPAQHSARSPEKWANFDDESFDLSPRNYPFLQAYSIN